MSDLKCTKCGMEASFADATIADRVKSCGSDDTLSEITAGDGSVKYVYEGQKHDWKAQ